MKATLSRNQANRRMKRLADDGEDDPAGEGSGVSSGCGSPVSSPDSDGIGRTSEGIE
jgi:hypothetical protein